MKPVFGTNVQAFCTEYQLKGMLLPVMLVNVTTPAGPAAVVINLDGGPGNDTLTAKGGSGTGYTFTLATGSSLPAGLSLSRTRCLGHEVARRRHRGTPLEKVRCQRVCNMPW